MRQDLLDMIKSLTANDRKNLGQKGNKLFQEGGELSKKILAYESVYANTHRFMTKNDVLEEIADNMLVLMSMLYDPTIDMSIEDLEEMMIRKGNKWAERQAAEDNIKYPLPYEIHVTIDVPEQEGPSVFEFKEACRDIGVKSVFLDLELNHGKVMKDYMTSSVFMGNNGEAIREVERISSELTKRGLKVVREKVETVPWHPAAPNNSQKHPKMPKDCYFESHFAIVTSSSKVAELKEAIKDIEAFHGARLHLSKNIFKKVDANNYVVMATYRNNDTVYEDFKKDVDWIVDFLQKSSFEVEKSIVEFSIWDTKVKHDLKWLSST